MSENEQVVGLSPENIGKVVTIQVFKKAEEGEDVILTETLEKHVGRLTGYSYVRRQGHTIMLEGWARPLSVVNKRQYLEVFPFVPNPIRVRMNRESSTAE